MADDPQVDGHPDPDAASKAEDDGSSLDSAAPADATVPRTPDPNSTYQPAAQMPPHSGFASTPQSGAENVAFGTPIQRHQFTLGAALAVILVTGVVIIGVLFAIGFVLRSESASKGQTVNVNLAAPTTIPSSTVSPKPTPFHLAAVFKPKKRPTHVPSATPTNTPTATATTTAVNTATAVPSATEVPSVTSTTIPSATSTDVPMATPIPGPNEDVSVCTDADYDKPFVLCTESDSSISTDAYYNSKIVVTGPNGGNFQHNTLLYVLSQVNSFGSLDVLGTANNTVPVADSRFSINLSWLFDATSTSPSFDGSSYLVEVDSGDESLGTFQFSLGGQDIVAQDTPTDVPEPVSTPSQNSMNYSATDACQGAFSPTDVVIRFYRAISLGAYSAAYQCFDAARQAKSPFNDWVQGYAGTLSSTLILAHQQANGLVYLDLHGVNRVNGKLQGTSYVGTWQIDGDFRMAVAHITVLRTYSLNSIPGVDYASDYSFDDQKIDSQVTESVTGEGNPDQAIISEATKCGNCTARRLSIYSDNMLVFSWDSADGIMDVEADPSGSGFTVTTPDGTSTYFWNDSGFEAS